MTARSSVVESRNGTLAWPRSVGERLGGLADQVRGDDVRPGDVLRELVEALALERAAEDELQRRLERGQCLACRGRVGRLRVVDKTDTRDLGDQLEPVRDTRKRAKRVSDHVVADPGCAGGCGRRGGVLAVVTAGDERLGGKLVVGRELHAPGRPRDRPEAAGDDRDVLPRLVLEDPQLRRPVGLEGAVAIEVIGLEVQQDGDARPERVDVLELEARQLANDPVSRSDGSDELAQRGADVAGRPRAQHRAEQLRCGRLPVRAGDPDDRVREQARRELDLAPDRDPSLSRPGDERCLAGHTGALDERVDTVEEIEIGVVSERSVGGDDRNAVRLERRLRRPPRARQAEHEHLPHSSWKSRK